MAAKFVEWYKNPSIEISEDRKTIKNNLDQCVAHCYLNVKMVSGIYHFIYEIHKYKNNFYFGCSTREKYNGYNIHKDDQSISIFIGCLSSELYGNISEKKKDGEFKEIVGKENGQYEVIFNMNDHTMSIKQGEAEPVLLYTNLKPTLFPFVAIGFNDAPVTLVNFFKEE